MNKILKLQSVFCTFCIIFKKVICIMLVLQLIFSNYLSIESFAEENDALQEIVAIQDFDFNDFSNWTKGFYTTSGTKLSSSFIRTIDYLSVTTDSTYTISFSSDVFKFVIYEYTDEYKYCAKVGYTGSGEYVPNANTSYVGIFLAPVTTANYQTYQEAFENGLTITVTESSTEQDEPVMADPDPDMVITEPAVTLDCNAYSFVDDMKVGWNLGNTLDAHTGELNGLENLNYEFVYGNCETTSEIIQFVADCGFDTIRIPVSWSFHTYQDETGHYKIYDSWFERVARIVDMSLDAGLNVIINSHHDYKLIYAGTDDESFASVCSAAQDIWSCVAQYFNDYDERVLFEGYNEIRNAEDGYVYSDLSASQTNALNQIFVDAVRATGGNNASRLLICPTLMDKYATPFMEAFELPQDSVEDRLIIEVHMYTDEFDQSIDHTFSELERYSEEIGAPIIIGEFGYSASYKLSDLRATAAGNFVARAYEHGIKAIVWDNGKSSDYGLVERRELASSNMEMLNAITNAAKYEGSEYTEITQYLVPEIKLTQTTGAIVRDVWWGSMVASSTDYIETLDPDAKYLKIKCVNNGDAYSRNIHYVDFYDADGNTLKMYSKGFPGYDFNYYAIPEGATSVNICILSSKYKTTKDQYLQYIEDGDLKLYVGYIY